MTTDNDKPTDLARRRLLRRLGLTGSLAYIAPALTALGQARASDASRGSRPSRSSRPSAPSRPSRPATTVRQTQVPQAAPAVALPEILALLPFGLATAAVEAAGYTVLDTATNPTLQGTVVRLGLPAGRSADAARDEIATLLGGVPADQNHLYRPDEFLCTDDGCAAHEMIGWSGWPSAYRPRIGMIDTGINVDHDALQSRKLTVYQSDLGGRDPAGRQHGTAIAAMLVGDIDSRVPGLLPHAELVAVEAFHLAGGSDAADAFSLLAAMDLLREAGVSVINLSFSGPDNALLEQMTRRTVAEGIAVVAAGGNGGAGAPPAYPAAWPHVVAVTAVDARERIYRQANQGPYISFAAPGVGVWTAASISGGRLRSGTSYAVPFVAATIAVEMMRTPDLPLTQIIEALIGCARDLGEAGYDPVFGNGLLSAPGQCFADEAQVFSVSGE